MKSSSILMTVLVGSVIVSGAVSCSTSVKISRIQSKGLNSTLTLPSEKELSRYAGEARSQSADSDGLYAMKVSRDEETGESMASEDLEAAVIVARFRNTAERRGMVNFDFMIVASDSLQDPSWQLRFYPTVYYDTDSLNLAPVYLSGADFRAAQLRAYTRYNDYLEGIRRDSLNFIDSRQRNAFNERFPQRPLSESDVDKHFERPLLIRYNAYKSSRKDAVREKLITAPLAGSEVRRDTTAAHSDERFIYLYRQSIPSRRSLHKFTLRVRTQIFDGKKVIYSFPASLPITYYVSSLSSLVDNGLASNHAGDSLYTKGVRALRDRNWEEALEALAPYEDYNSALAYVSLEYNATACGVLEGCGYEAANVCYLKALAYSRRGLEEQAVEQLCRAVELEPTYRHRGNLDPEIASLINKYALFEEEEY